MARYRNKLPQLGDTLFVTDGGAETTFIFHEGFELPEFAAFHLLHSDTGRAAIERYFDRYLQVAQTHRLGMVLESVTWRASRDWGARIGYDDSQVAAANRKAIELLAGIRQRHDSAAAPLVISGNIGPRDDGYNPSDFMTVDEARRYHAIQVETFRDTEADMVSAFTMTYSEEAIGITRAAQAASMPVAISFTVETDGHLPSGQPLAEAINATDEATADGPAYYMINCAHPEHFRNILNESAPWLSRIRGIRANASTLSHAELDEAEELDEGNPQELGEHYRELHRMLPNLNIVGGCCGTDHRHIDAICTAISRQ